jgi:hypothetical protein
VLATANAAVLLPVPAKVVGRKVVPAAIVRRDLRPEPVATATAGRKVAPMATVAKALPVRRVTAARVAQAVIVAKGLRVREMAAHAAAATAPNVRATTASPTHWNSKVA